MIVAVLGAPGSGKSSVAEGLRTELRGWTVIDWDCLMPAVERLTGRDVRTSPGLWEPYAHLVRTVVDAACRPVVLLTVCTPAELIGWPIERWILLDVGDDERRRRLSDRSSEGTAEAVRDAEEYRALGLPTVDSTMQPIELAVRDLAAAIRAA